MDPRRSLMFALSMMASRSDLARFCGLLALAWLVAAQAAG